MLDNSADHNVDSNFFSYGTSKQDMPHSSDVSSKNILVGKKFSRLIDCTTPDDETASLKNDITTFSEVIPHVDLKNNNKISINVMIVYRFKNKNMIYLKLIIA